MIAHAALQTHTRLCADRKSSARESPASDDDPAVSALEMALDCLGQAILIVDEEAHIHFSSAAARQLFGNGRLGLQNGALRVTAGSETLLISSLMTGRFRTELAQGGMLFRRVGQSNACLQVAVVKLQGRPGGTGQQFYSVSVTDLRHLPIPDALQLKAQFGLTAAQSTLAVQIVQGHGLGSCARQLGISLSTARTHLRRIFEKTGTKRQAELVRLISVLYPVFRPGGSRKSER